MLSKNSELMSQNHVNMMIIFSEIAKFLYIISNNVNTLHIFEKNIIYIYIYTLIVHIIVTFNYRDGFILFAF